jgi:dienelactone hydrolase
LAAGGYLAVAPLLYYQTGGPAFSVDDHPVAEKTFARLRPGDLAEDLVGTLHHLERRVGIAHNAIAMAGIGAGGHLAAWGAAHHRLFAALAVDLRPGPWSELPGPETPAVQLGERWLVRPDVAGVWDEAVGFFDTMFARRSR